MADIEKLIPHVLKWECGVSDSAMNRLNSDEGSASKAQDSSPAAVQKRGSGGGVAGNAALFERCRKVGYAEVAGDFGGPTMCGVTIGTFREWRREHGGRSASVEDLKGISYGEWLEIMKAKFWDACQGDRIENQRVANMLVDWRWVNGTQAVRDAQTALGLVADGIVGPKTLSALNGDPEAVFRVLKGARIRSYKRIVDRRPGQKKFYRGWVNRVEDI